MLYMLYMLTVISPLLVSEDSVPHPPQTSWQNGCKFLWTVNNRIAIIAYKSFITACVRELYCFASLGCSLWNPIDLFLPMMLPLFKNLNNTCIVQTVGLKANTHTHTHSSVWEVVSYIFNFLWHEPYKSHRPDGSAINRLLWDYAETP